MVDGNIFGRLERDTTRTSWLRGNLAHRRNEGMANVSEGTLYTGKATGKKNRLARYC